jgi:hypothetical protein
MAIGAGLSYSPQVGVLEVAQAAVDHLEGLGGGGAREIASLEEGDRQTPAGRVARRAGAEDPAADHDQIELAFRE